MFRAERCGDVRGEERTRLRASFGALLWQHRIGCGWTQAKLAQVAGVHPDTVRRWESGAVRPTDATCFQTE